MCAQGDAGIGGEGAELDAVDVAHVTGVEVVDERLPRGITRARRVGGRNRRGLDDADGADVELARRRQQRAAGLHRGAHPAAERQRDLAGADAVEHRLAEDHRAGPWSALNTASTCTCRALAS